MNENDLNANTLEFVDSRNFNITIELNIPFTEFEDSEISSFSPFVIYSDGNQQFNFPSYCYSLALQISSSNSFDSFLYPFEVSEETNWRHMNEIRNEMRNEIRNELLLLTPFLFKFLKIVVFKKKDKRW